MNVDRKGPSIGQHAAKAVVVADTALRTIVTACLYAPVILIVVLSFANGTILRFPPESWGFRQYRTLFGSSYWLGAMRTSLEVSAISAAIALAVGVPVTIAIYRTRLPFKGLIQLIALSPLVLPGVAYALSLYTIFVAARIEGSMKALVLTYSVLGMPLVILVVGPAMARVSTDLELVAMTLGASRTRAILGITLRMLAPAVGAAFIFAFIFAFDDAVFINFVGGPTTVTLSKAIFDSVKVGIDPVITAVATLLMVTVGLTTGVAFAWRRHVWTRYR